ncbi:hypothetical protein AMEX_G16660 [Astyanax mexicanus]|uniref:Uncharacterized protein n=2 Tax=Astyanax mexicanus TaxID=7994 RepID=A0A8T2LL70_ASTMX|nr:hypothetical protein AMEX_G16660 [Astyanax mexicanus]
MTDPKADTHSVQSENTLALNDSDTDYKQYLFSLFGESTAEYFLNLSSLRQNTPAWYTHMRDNMKGHVNAVALWDALRQRSAQIMKEKETKPSQAETDWKKLMREDHLHRISAIRQMFRSAQRNQAYTALLLQHRPLSLLCNTDTTEGSSQYPSDKHTRL